MKTLVEISGASISTPGGRPLFEGLELALSRERVALIGRNGAGKSTLLAVLAGALEPRAGTIKTSSEPYWVPQTPSRADGFQLSHGELRRRELAEAQASRAEILLLDEPSEALDEPTVAWLRGWLREWQGCLVVATHDRRLLEDFQHFFIVSESGSRYFSGTLAELDAEVEREHRETERRYVGNLHRLSAYEEHTLHVARRKARKKRNGRCRELDRATSRMRLNRKRGEAEVNHGKLAKVRRARLDTLRQWSKATRRALDVDLSLELPVPALPPATEDVLVLRGVSASAGERNLFAPLDLRLARQRVALVGPNGAGKTTLIDIMLGRRAPASGSSSRDLSKIGAIAQGGADWISDDSLLAHLLAYGAFESSEELAQALVSHKSRSRSPNARSAR